MKSKKSYFDDILQKIDDIILYLKSKYVRILLEIYAIYWAGKYVNFFELFTIITV